MKPVLAPIFTVVCLLVSSVSVQAASACFAGRDPIFTPYAGVEMSSQELGKSLKKTCDELTKPENYVKQDLVMTAFMGLARFVGLGLMFGQGVAAFSDMDGTPEQMAYMAELQKIRQIENPMERIRQVYNLAAKAQGPYDYDNKGFRTWTHGKIIFAHTPENILDSQKKYGASGVCREFAALLQWSLMQVARHPSSKTGGLTPKDFNSEIAAGAPGGQGHAWVRVHLPVHSDTGMILGFQDFDLDTTWHPERFAILSPRESGISEPVRKSLLDQCRQIYSCVTQP